MHKSKKIGETLYIDQIEYQVEGIKEGGMGIVYILKRLTQREGIDRIHLLMLAAKTLKDQFNTEDPGFYERELNIWITLDHPNIIPLLKICIVQNKLLALMPVCSGSLRETLQRQGKFRPNEAVEVIKQILSALTYASESFQIVHLDIKPENILVLNISRDKPKYLLSDWGISSIQKHYCFTHAAISDMQKTVCRTFNNFGTLPYMGPERFLPDTHSTIASDVYSVGLIFYELLFGTLPFDFSSGKSFELQILNMDYFDIANRQLLSLGNERIRHVILNCIHPDPRRRYSDYKGFNKDMNRIENPLSSLWSYFR